MSVENDRIEEQFLSAAPAEDGLEILVISRDAAAEERRQAAEHGDYQLAERWLWHEQLLDAEEAFREQQ